MMPYALAGSVTWLGHLDWDTLGHLDSGTLGHLDSGNRGADIGV